jgi:hypothetical protein
MTGSASMSMKPPAGESRLEQLHAKPGWREAWEDLEPHLSTPVLSAMLAGLESNDARIVQGVTHQPSLARAPSNAPPECGCLVAFGLWVGEGLETIGQIDQRFSQVNRAVPTAYRVFGAFDASQSIEEARRLFLPVVRAAVARRQREAAEQAAEKGKAVPA